MKVAFFGTSDRSIPILESLKKNFELVLCVTKDDVKVGRHQILKEVEVKKWAKNNRVNFLTIDSMNAEMTEKIISTLKFQSVEIGIVADFSYIIPESVINIPKYKLVNIHFSLLPKYRGASPVQFAILNGDKSTGITVYIVDKGLDTGKIIFQKEFELVESENSRELYRRLFNEAALELPRVIIDYTKGTIKPKRQNENNATYTFSKTNPKTTFILKEDALINWDETAEKNYRVIKAFNPWPIAWTYLRELKNKRTKELLNIPKYTLRTGKSENIKIKIYDAKQENGRLKILELQVEGGKKISWGDFLNGYFEKKTEN